MTVYSVIFWVLTSVVVTFVAAFLIVAIEAVARNIRMRILRRGRRL